jgi:two-component system nitrogen regulation sensor histidine kinase NtrY
MPSFLKGNYLYAAGVFSVFVLIFVTFEMANVVHGLVADSKISFDVTNFFSLDVYTITGLIVLALITLSYYYFTRLLFHFIFPVFRNHYSYIYFIMALVGLVYLTLRSGNSIVLFHLPVLLWLVLYTLLVSRENFIVNQFRATIAGMLFWIFVFSVSLSVMIMQANREKEARVRRAVAENLYQISEPSSNLTMSIAITYLDNRFLVNNFRRFLEADVNRFLRDSITRSSFAPGYAANFDTRIYLFDSLNKPIYNDDPMTYVELNTIFTSQSKTTGIPDLYFHENSSDQFSYIMRRVVKDSNGLKGNFFIVSTPRRFGNSDAIYAELFREANRRGIDNSDIYFYALYEDGCLVILPASILSRLRLIPASCPEVNMSTDPTMITMSSGTKPVTTRSWWWPRKKIRSSKVSPCSLICSVLFFLW